VAAACGSTETDGATAPDPNLPEDRICSGYPDQATTPYVLPYPVGQSPVVGNGNCAEVDTHRGIARYAYDFIMPIGTPVVAARPGVVIGTEERFHDGNRVPGDENQVFVEHDDGSVARYYHLAYNSVVVFVGQTVAQGQVLAQSGDTGNSNGPHLHFDVTIEDCGEPFFGPRCITVPVTFWNTRPHPDGLQAGEAYTALPY